MRSFFTAIGVVFSLTGFTQTVTTTLEIPAGVHDAYLDRAGYLYIHTNDSALMRYDLNGTLQAKTKISFATVFDPWYSIRMLHYVSPTRSYRLLDQALEVVEENTLDEALVIEPSLVCFSGDQNLWVVDQADGSIKRINTTRQSVEAERRIPEPHARIPIRFAREYQHFLFLLNDSGILIFNSIGILIRHIPATGIEYFNFLGEELYYKKGNELVYFDLMDGLSRTEILPPGLRFQLLTDNQMVRVYPTRVEILNR
jgi:hypothetical protein